MARPAEQVRCFRGKHIRSQAWAVAVAVQEGVVVCVGGRGACGAATKMLPSANKTKMAESVSSAET